MIDLDQVETISVNVGAPTSVMKYSSHPSLGLAVIVGISLATQAFAVVSIDWVTVGDAGNASDPLTGYGAVGYEYRIGKYEVTNAQYAEFLNAKGQSNANGIYNSEMSNYGITQLGSSGSYAYSVTTALANYPVSYVSWFDAARFANWLLNGQANGDTEAGAYTLNGAMSGIIMKNAGAQVHLPSQNEWYKAAYYNGAGANYTLYPNGQNSISISEANFAGDWTTTEVGSYAGNPGPYGTFDQGGNVWEWNDAVVDVTSRGIRGGSFYYDESFISSLRYIGTFPSSEGDDLGFRVAGVPEPSTLILTMLASVGLAARRKR